MVRIFANKCLSEDIKSLDAVVLTHEHNDHIIGLDDIRPFNFHVEEKYAAFCYKTSVTAEPYINDSIMSLRPVPYPGAPTA